MKQKKLYVIGGCNGAGKTTASFNILPEILDCKEFVNADEIAKGLSPFRPDTVSIEAGRLMLKRIEELLNSGVDFAFETTLSTKSFIKTIEKAQNLGFYVTLIFFYLDSPELAKDRVAKRVAEGGHNIETEIIERRYFAGIRNLFSLYQSKVDYLLIYDNSSINADLIAEKEMNKEFSIFDAKKFEFIRTCHEHQRNRNFKEDH